MIERYTLPEMGSIWASHKRFEYLLMVEKAVAVVQARLGIIPEEAARAIQKKGKVDEARILEIEKTTKHDVIAFVSQVAETVGNKWGRFIHFGLTSSDALDTALSLQVREAITVLNAALSRLSTVLEEGVRKYAELPCAGRTHGMHAEPTTLGYKLAGYLAELRRNQLRLQEAAREMAICKLSGAVGTYANLSPKVEREVAKELGLSPETIATQVIPRDRHAVLFTMLAVLGGGIERVAVELRHLQRTEVGEVSEGFSKGQKGSSAMPHKKNPISAENLTGCARLLRGYAQAAMENIALWHERDISHSSVERVIFPDAFILAHYMTVRLTNLIEGMEVYPERMKENMDRSQGQLWSSQLLLLFIEKGLTREEAYAHAQRLAHSLERGEHLQEKVLQDEELKKIVSAKEVQDLFAGTRFLRQIGTTLQGFLKKR